MSLKDYKQTQQQWGLSDNPFDFTPPDDFELVAKIFQGRSQELDNALPALYEGRNVLIRGTWGIGKTALIKTLLYRLQQEVAELGEEMLVLYLGGIPKATVADFYRAVLLAITQQMSRQSAEAKKVADSLTGSPAIASPLSPKKYSISSSKPPKAHPANLIIFAKKSCAKRRCKNISRSILLSGRKSGREFKLV